MSAVLLTLRQRWNSVIFSDTVLYIQYWTKTYETCSRLKASSLRALRWQGLTQFMTYAGSATDQKISASFSLAIGCAVQNWQLSFLVQTMWPSRLYCRARDAFFTTCDL